MKQSILKIILIVIVMISIMWILIFKTPLGSMLNNAGEGLENINKNSLRLIGAMVFINLSAIFAISGYIMSKQKGKNILKWTLLCAAFNFVAFLFLIFSPTEEEP